MYLFPSSDDILTACCWLVQGGTLTHLCEKLGVSASVLRGTGSAPTHTTDPHSRKISRTRSRVARLSSSCPSALSLYEELWWWPSRASNSRYRSYRVEAFLPCGSFSPCHSKCIRRSLLVLLWTQILACSRLWNWTHSQSSRPGFFRPLRRFSRLSMTRRLSAVLLPPRAKGQM